MKIPHCKKFIVSSLTWHSKKKKPEVASYLRASNKQLPEIIFFFNDEDILPRKMDFYVMLANIYVLSVFKASDFYPAFIFLYI